MSANVRYTQFRAEAQQRAVQQAFHAPARTDRGGVLLGEALVVARALLRHPPVRVEPGTPEERWLDELASLVGKACLKPGAQGSRATAGGSSKGGHRRLPRPPAPAGLATNGMHDLHSWLQEIRASEDDRTTLERARECRREAREGHASSGSPVRGTRGQALEGGAPRPGGGFQKPVPAKLGAGKFCEIHRFDRRDLTVCRLVKGLAEDHRKERGDRVPMETMLQRRPVLASKSHGRPLPPSSKE
ncbi:retrotransposon protein, putative, unclassified [Panicum miliaceum]|uniref:Retrotransposon protein, putative, unclassified n=1 Tax=Panicum miliaceum TaxID=4540 RepID=A0A3L6SWP8_PANMI|nr:retrotransposon protein, putative, unclassified [Panicum miliaceum]